jgi:tetratricopeptide (TPR) repeat protein
MLILVTAGVAVYANSLHGPFILDDLSSIVENPTIRHLPGSGQKPFGVRGETVAGRPLLNLSFAANYALGSDLRGFHLTNLAIHILAALTLYGVLRRTFALAGGGIWTAAGRANVAVGTAKGGSKPAGQLDPASASAIHCPPATFFAFAIALLWLLHPLQTESVTYVVQRAESLSGLFYLLTIYCVIRGAELAEISGWGSQIQAPRPAFSRLPRFLTPHPFAWYLAAVGACFLGVATKEVLVTAPLVVLLYDRTFLAGSFARAWRCRRGLYIGLAASWVLLAALMISTHGRGSTVGFGSGVTTWDYAVTQCAAIARYIRLSLCPTSLCVDYGVWVAKSASEILPGAILLVVLVAMTSWALVRRPGVGFLGAFFLATLAPTSSFIPVGTQTMAEHRMYLSLAALIATVVISGDLLLCRLLWQVKMPESRRVACHQVVAVALVAAAALALGVRTRLRNDDYRTELSIWGEAVRCWPQNDRAHNNLGKALTACGNGDEATVQYRMALAINPQNVEAHNNLGNALAGRGQLDEAISHYRKALQIDPEYTKAEDNFGNALLSRGQVEDAVALYQKALQHDPDNAEAHNNLGNALVRRGQVVDAIAQFQQAIQLNPDLAKAHNNLGNALAGRGQAAEAIAHYRKAVEIQPDYEMAQVNLGNALADCGQPTEAIAHYRRTLEINPGDAQAHYRLGGALLGRGAIEEAIRHCRKALEIQPDVAEAHYNLGNALASCGRVDEAILHYQRALEIRPDVAVAHNNLGLLLAGRGHVDEAIAHYRKALALNPQGADTHNNLGNALAGRGELEEAIAHYRKALEIQPGLADTRRNLAIVLAERERRERLGGGKPGPRPPSR